MAGILAAAGVAADYDPVVVTLELAKEAKR